MKTKLFIGLLVISAFLSTNAFAQLDACGNPQNQTLGSGLVTISGWMFKNGSTGFPKIGGGIIGNTPAIIYACPFGVKVGIGTATPQTTLDVNGDVKISQQLNVSQQLNANSFATINRGLAIGFVNSNVSNYDNGGLIVQGSVGIGTDVVGGFKLAVDGKIGAREIRVLAGTGAFPDYVFKKGYKLRTLKDLEDFISENGHLPNIPSAEEVKINNGIDLGDMNVKLLEKVEELTLYLIKQQKEIEELKLKIEKK